MSRVFLLSPARSSGPRATLLTSRRARFDLAMRVQSAQGAALGEVMRFLSGLYFRGKEAYALAFAAPPPHVPGALVITPNAGLQPLDRRVDAAELRRLGSVDIALGEPRFRKPLAASAMSLAGRLGPSCEVVLLGSIATDKYVDVLVRVFGERLLFPRAFVGRGDMSRGGLMLRAARAGVELTYEPVVGAVRHGKKPPRLPSLRRPARRP